MTEAIKEVIRAYAEPGDNPDEYLLTDYVIVAAGARFDNEGVSFSRVSLMMRDSDVPAYKIVGLLEFARARCKMWIDSDED